MLISLLFACGVGIENPTGTCEPDGDGSRLCYSAPAPADTYLPDCDAPLAREYWRVFAVSSESAYIIPRPDGASAVAEACAGDDADLVALLDRYTLCGSVDVEQVNDMALADALAITHALHQRLRFEAVDANVEPFVPPDDGALICASADPAMADWCGFQPTSDGGNCTDIGYGYASDEEAQAVAAAANALYGVTP